MFAAVVLASVLAQGSTVERQLYPVQVHLAGSAGFGSTLLMRAHLAAAGTLGWFQFDELGDGKSNFVGLGAYGFLDQPAAFMCQPNCGRMGAGPMLRVGFARRDLGSAEPGALVPDWYGALDLALVYGRQIDSMPLSGKLESMGLRLAASLTGPIWTKRLLKKSNDTQARVFGIFNHAGLFVEGSRHYDGMYRMHGGVEIGAGF